MLKKILLGLAAFFVVAQLIRPGMQNPSLDPNLDLQKAANPPAEVLSSLKKACYDCHSNETKWPWYSQIAPVSWWTANHVVEGREHLNFSTFAQLSPGDRAEALEEAGEAIQEGEMPMSSYLWMHPEAKLSGEEKQALLAWLSANGGEGSSEAGSEAGGEDDDD